MTSLPVRFAACLVCCAFAAGPAGAVDEPLEASIADDYDQYLEALFVHFHRNPELSNLEVETARRMAEELRAIDFEVTEGIGGTGVAALMENGPGPVVMVRADMDGLPIREESGLDYASTVTQVDESGVEQPVMHACGHDVHITALLGTARQMARRRDEWSGTLMLVVQPAEERISGARAMMEDGLYERIAKPDYALAFHVDADERAGKVYFPLSVVASSADSVDIRVRGVGTHGAYPHMGVDPVLVAAQIVVSLQSLVSRTLPPLEAGVITVGAINGGSKHNIIGDHVDLQLTVRSDSPETRMQLLDGIDRVARGVALSLNVPEDLLPEVRRSSVESTPPTINNRDLVERVGAALSRDMEIDVSEYERTGMGAEDFSYFVQPETDVPGLYFGVGGTAPENMDNPTPHHSPLFRIEPEPSIRAGVETSVRAAMMLMPVGADTGSAR